MHARSTRGRKVAALATGAIAVSALGLASAVPSSAGIIAAHTVSVGDVSIVEGNTPLTRTAQLRLTLSGSEATDTFVTWTTVNGGAVGNAKKGLGDFVSKSLPKPGKTKIPAGKVTALISVPITGDTSDESNETFGVHLEAVTGSSATIDRDDGTVTIIDDDPSGAPTVSIGDSTLVEGNSGYQTAPMRVELSAPQASDVTVTYQTAPGSATAPSDYKIKPATSKVKIAAGKTTGTIAPIVYGDTAPEPNESFTVQLTGVTGGAGVSLLKSTGTVTILDDDTMEETDLPSAPGKPVASHGAGLTINVNWTAPASDGGSPITGYHVEVTEDGGSSWIDLGTVAGTHKTDVCGTGAHCAYHVAAQNANGEGPFSAVSDEIIGGDGGG